MRISLKKYLQERKIELSSILPILDGFKTLEDRYLDGRVFMPNDVLKDVSKALDLSSNGKSLIFDKVPMVVPKQELL